MKWFSFFLINNLHKVFFKSFFTLIFLTWNRRSNNLQSNCKRQTLSNVFIHEINKIPSILSVHGKLQECVLKHLNVRVHVFINSSSKRQITAECFRLSAGERKSASSRTSTWLKTGAEFKHVGVLRISDVRLVKWLASASESATTSTYVYEIRKMAAWNSTVSVWLLYVRACCCCSDEFCKDERSWKTLRRSMLISVWQQSEWMNCFFFYGSE